MLCFLFLLLIAVRGFASKLFYDPFIEYFKNDYLYAEMPEINNWRLMINMLFRYTLNSLISLGIIWLIFKKKEPVKFSGFFLMIAFIILIITFMFLIKGEFKSGYLLPFYIL